MAIKVNVTQEHIDKGDCGDTSNCPIALAIIDQYPKSGQVMVLSYLVYCLSNYYVLPEIAQDFIDVFDHTRSQAKPFSFELEEM